MLKKRRDGVLKFEDETAPAKTDRDISALGPRQPGFVQLSSPGQNMCIRADRLLGI